MKRIPRHTTEKEVLIGIEEQLKQLTEALRERNEILKSLIGQPEGQPARLLTSVISPVEAITF